MISTKLRVKEYLRERRWTTKVLAEKTGMSESYLTHIKNGTRRWNEDALKKLAEAFEIDATDLFETSNQSRKDLPVNIQIPDEIRNQLSNYTLKLKIVPVVGQIPSQPSAYNNQLVQVSSGYKDQFVTVLDSDDKNMFCLAVEDNGMAPNFVKGDLLVVSPSTWTNSGDIVAVEYGTETPTRAIMQVNFMDDLVVLEAVNHKKAPIALSRGKDQFRIIGKVIHRFQKI
ncbi:MAG: XRE family transcriptional regulator [Candidatus Babeliales bacterium]|jgi:SOS-response transcriptional repressor LexA|nr:MAG: MerR family transcriptional regulator [candidate division TM6 bacterium GW2011_GWF2_36_6]